MSYLFDVEDDREDDFAGFIDTYTTSQEPLMNYESRQRYTNEFSSMTGLITLVGGVLTTVVGVIVPYLAWLPQRKESVVSVISREA